MLSNTIFLWPDEGANWACWTFHTNFQLEAWHLHIWMQYVRNVAFKTQNQMSLVTSKILLGKSRNIFARKWLIENGIRWCFDQKYGQWQLSFQIHMYFCERIPCQSYEYDQNRVALVFETFTFAIGWTFRNCFFGVLLNTSLVILYEWSSKIKFVLLVQTEDRLTRLGRYLWSNDSHI